MIKIGMDPINSWKIFEDFLTTFDDEETRWKIVIDKPLSDSVNGGKPSILFRYIKLRNHTKFREFEDEDLTIYKSLKKKYKCITAIKRLNAEKEAIAKKVRASGGMTADDLVAMRFKKLETKVDNNKKETDKKIETPYEKSESKVDDTKNRLDTETQKQIEDLKKEKDQQIEDLKKEKDRQIEDLKKERDRQIEDLKKEFMNTQTAVQTAVLSSNLVSTITTTVTNSVMKLVDEKIGVEVKKIARLRESVEKISVNQTAGIISSLTDQMISSDNIWCVAIDDGYERICWVLSRNYDKHECTVQFLKKNKEVDKKNLFKVNKIVDLSAIRPLTTEDDIIIMKKRSLVVDVDETTSSSFSTPSAKRARIIM